MEELSTQDTTDGFHSESCKAKYEDILAESNARDHRTKIVCTMGPSCSDVSVLVQLLDAGMNIARLNFSHGSHKSHKAMLDNIREALKLRPHKTCAIMLDTKGPEI